MNSNQQSFLIILCGILFIVWVIALLDKCVDKNSRVPIWISSLMLAATTISIYLLIGVVPNNETVIKKERLQQLEKLEKDVLPPDELQKRINDNVRELSNCD